MKFSPLAALALWLSALPTMVHAADCNEQAEGLLLFSCDGTTQARLHLNPMGTVLDNGLLPESEQTLLTITGTYTSGERHEPEGMYILNGEALDPYIQGWDGLLHVTSDGALSLHHVERVSIDGERWNLRRKFARRSFVHRADAENWSILQSHLLIIDGKVDTKPVEGASRFRRRLLFTLEEGAFGIWQSDDALTLHDAALRLNEIFNPVMALNLDMGSHDFCMKKEETGITDCGNLLLEDTGRLSNVIVFSVN